MARIARLAATMAVLIACGTAHGRVTRIVIDETVSMPPDPAAGTIAYERIAGRAFGQLDPKLAQNAIIQDIELGRAADGLVHYVASFVITKPVDLGHSSGLMWHEVPNRGYVFPVAPQERAFGDIDLASAWQGDNSGNTAVRAKAGIATGQFLKVPVAHAADGATITGAIFGRIVNRSGAESQPLMVQGNPLPYRPQSLDTKLARLVSRGHESMSGEVNDEVEIAAADWSWGHCDADHHFPGLPDATEICLRHGFDPQRLYQVIFTAADPYVLGVGFAAWRDVGWFFKTSVADDAGTPNPIAKAVKFSVGRGISQSGNFLRGWLHLGFNQAEGVGQVHDGLWVIIAGRRIALNFRWAQPDGVTELYQAGNEGPQWWLPAADPVRGLPPAGIVDRCSASHTCPKIFEHFGSAEVWALKLSLEWVGADGKADLPLPSNVRRYYMGSSNHGGGAGGFSTKPPAGGPNCPGNNFGTGLLAANPMPHTETVNALRVHLRDWVMKGTAPPPSRYPTLAAGTLALADKGALGYPALPGLRPTLPETDFINPVLDYDWGPQFNPQDGSGVPTNVPPKIRQVLRMFAPKVDADGNELGGVPVVLAEAPLGTYLGWNVTAGGARPFHQGQLCNYVGGMVPFATTAAERGASGDTRLSLQERYGDHEGYVAAVAKAAAKAEAEGFLLPEDRAALIDAAKISDVLR